MLNFRLETVLHVACLLAVGLAFLRFGRVVGCGGPCVCLGVGAPAVDLEDIAGSGFAATYCNWDAALPVVVGESYGREAGGVVIVFCGFQVQVESESRGSCSRLEG